MHPASSSDEMAGCNTGGTFTIHPSHTCIFLEAVQMTHIDNRLDPWSLSKKKLKERGFVYHPYSIIELLTATK